MKISLLTLAALAAFTACAAPAFAGDVTITLTGVQARGGDLLVGLQTADQFMKHEGTYGEIVSNPSAGTQTITLHGVAAGDYSVSALHDVDSDRQMGMENGRPAEGWGLLHGESLRAAPTFDQVKFSVPATGDIALNVAMIYPAR
ncbi:DUF2141 domain-containing protein [Brevundimonas subvibrioides]|uniref:DUF2141 domain-containing protein n=1 Tax=Brevundimonas subvibrioides TaxID=74313 RepID=UPI0022B54E1F|nr:DUF2141 domain-containing protein [Brevundimonas subvibrioides]